MDHGLVERQPLLPTFNTLKVEQRIWLPAQFVAILLNNLQAGVADHQRTLRAARHVHPQRQVLTRRVAITYTFTFSALSV